MQPPGGSFEVHVSAYGRAASDLLGRQVDEAQRGDRLGQVTVVVPSNYAAVAARRELAARPGGWRR